MALPQAPSYLKQSAKAAINDVARQGVGSSMPPHVSIKGNVFTLVDAAGNTYNGGPVIQAVVVDVSDVTCKIYYGGKPYVPGSDDPPVCFSTNGVGPSIEALEPQSSTCAACPMNVRGSATSKMSGAAIKACRDETHLALMFPQQPDMLFRLVVTPGSFKAWGAYIDSIKGVALQDLVTQFEFVPQENGVLLFSAPAYIPEATIGWREQAYLEKKTDTIVGRTDKPRTAALPAPAQQEQVALPNMANMSQQVQQSAPLQPALPAAGPSLPQMQSTAPALAASVTTEAPAAEQPRRRRRAAADPAPAAAPTTASPPAAPFRPAAAPAANPAFGVGQGAAPNAELGNMLNQIFPQAAK